MMGHREDGEAFLAKNKTAPGVQTTASGLQYKITEPGTGKRPGPRSTVEVHYHGTFLDGKVFDSSVERKETIEFPLDGVIPGWTEGLQLIQEGGKVTLYVPYKLGYGERGYPGAIPGYATLIFDVELIKVK